MITKTDVFLTTQTSLPLSCLKQCNQTHRYFKSTVHTSMIIVQVGPIIGTKLLNSTFSRVHHGPVPIPTEK